MKHIVLIGALFFGLVVQSSWAQIPRAISYQGILTDAAGNLVPDGPYTLTFRIYNVETGGAALKIERKGAELGIIQDHSGLNVL